MFADFLLCLEGHDPPLTNSRPGVYWGCSIYGVSPFSRSFKQCALGDDHEGPALTFDPCHCGLYIHGTFVVGPGGSWAGGAGYWVYGYASAQVNTTIHLPSGLDFQSRHGLRLLGEDS
jgi:hypothetical protein